MTLIRFVLGLLISLLATAALAQLAPVPALTARVTDVTGTLSGAQVAQLEASLAALEKRKGAQLAILMVPTTQPEAIEQYSIRAAEQWKLGRGRVDGKKVDDGVLLLVAKNDRKLRIEVGYGLEGAIPDALAKRIIAETISPHFKQGDFFGGLQAGVTDLTRLIDQEALPEPWQGGQGGNPNGNRGTGGLDLSGLLPVLLLVVFAGLTLTRLFGRVLGSGLGGVGAGLLGGFFAGSLVIGLVAGVIALVVLLVMSAATGAVTPFGRRTYGSTPVIFPGGWGGGSGGGGFGGGGGGGFSGGGGGFGGGGSSGSW